MQKCVAGKERQVRAIFETHPFGDMERLVTQKLLDVVKKGAKDELDNEAVVALGGTFGGTKL